MTLLYGKDANGNQVPLLVSANGTVQTSGLWFGTSSQLTAGDGSAVTVGSGLALAGGTLAASGASFSTVWDVDWKAQTPATFTTTVSTATISGVTCSFQLGLGSGGTGTYTLSAANGLRATHTNSSGYAAGYFWADLVNLGLFLNLSVTRWWTMWDSSAGAAWSSPGSFDEAFGGGASVSVGPPLAFTYITGAIRNAGIRVHTTGGLSSGNITSAATQTADVFVYEINPSTNTWTLYTGTSVGGNWPTASALNKTLVSFIPSAYYTNSGNGLFLSNGSLWNIMQIFANAGSMGILRSRIDKQ
jgi:hypothetical protein